LGFQRLAVFERLNDEARARFSWIGTGSQATGVVSASGGISHGQLGKVDGIRYTNQKLFTLTTVDIGKNQYFREFIGQQYSDNTWKDTIAESLNEDCKSDLFDVMDKNAQFKELLDGGTDSYYDIAHRFSYSIKYNSGDAEEKGTYYYTDVDTYSLFEKVEQDSDNIFGLRSGTALSRSLNNYLSEEKSLRDSVYDAYLDVPDSTAELINNLMGNVKVSTLEQKENYIKYVKDYLAANYTYTLTPGKVPEGEDFIEYFLMDSKQGYCTYFATAAVMMYRCAGIPARYVEGYVVSRSKIIQGSAYQTTVKRESESGDVTLDYTGYKTDVYDNACHAWAEVYMDGYGWVEVEVTPFNGIGTGTEENDMTLRNETADQTDLTQDVFADEFTEEEETEETTRTELPSAAAESENAVSYEDTEKTFADYISELPIAVKIIIVIAAFLILALLVILVQYIIRLERKRNAKLSMKEKLLNEYAHLEEVLAFTGFERSEVLEYEAYAGYLAEKSDISEAADIKRIMELVLKGRFSGGDVTREEYRETSRKMRMIRNGLYKKMSFGKRLIFKYIKVL
jgi:transglutaminase-like putative cysteine protease